ncbi:hypothetical protein HZY88_08460 [Aerococcaceae bacterium DSM 111176]|nr:hypothetical protein [Aerococcaceae bacterium DSM 111176]
MGSRVHSTMNDRIEELAEEVKSLKQLVYELEHAAARLIDEKIEEATSGLVSIEELEYYG